MPFVWILELRVSVMIWSAKKYKWQKWFAWFPVKLDDGRKAWLINIERKYTRVPYARWSSYWTYREHLLNRPPDEELF